MQICVKNGKLTGQVTNRSQSLINAEANQSRNIYLCHISYKWMAALTFNIIFGAFNGISLLFTHSYVYIYL